MTDAARSWRSGGVVRGVMIGGTILLCLVLASFPTRTWLDQRAELREAENRHTELQAEIEASDARIAAKLDEEGVRRDARCFSHFVEPGDELYTVPGVEGCVPGP